MQSAMRGIEGRQLLDYRAYVMDHHGHIDDVRLIRARHDPAACEAARNLRLNGQFELWCEGRVVSCAGSRSEQTVYQGNPFGSGPLPDLLNQLVSPPA